MGDSVFGKLNHLSLLLLLYCWKLKLIIIITPSLPFSNAIVINDKDDDIIIIIVILQNKHS